jgi:hypothetical protein
MLWLIKLQQLVVQGIGFILYDEDDLSHYIREVEISVRLSVKSSSS